jgi:hypothetical protein
MCLGHSPNRKHIHAFFNQGMKRPAYSVNHGLRGNDNAGFVLSEDLSAVYIIAYAGHGDTKGFNSRKIHNYALHPVHLDELDSVENSDQERVIGYDARERQKHDPMLEFILDSVAYQRLIDRNAKRPGLLRQKMSSALKLGREA